MPPERVEEVLSSLTKESFVGGQSAYQLDDGSYSIDVGENDIRAIYDQENAEIKFFCRYKRDMNFYDKKLMVFTTNMAWTRNLAPSHLNIEQLLFVLM